MVKTADAGPGLSVGIAHFDAAQVALIRQPHIYAHERVSELRNSTFGQDEMGGRTALGAEMNFRIRVFLVSSAISSRRTVDAHFQWGEVSPASARFAAQRAVTFIDIIRLSFHRDVDLTAKAGKRHRMTTMARGEPGR